MTRDDFNLDPRLIYLNSGTHSILPRTVFDEVQRIQSDYEKNPTAGLIHVWDALWKAQTDLADFFGADPRDLFLRSNITQVLNQFILGCSWPVGRSELLTTNWEYGAIVNICRYRAERDGLRLRSIPMPSDPVKYQSWSENEWVRHVVSGLTPETGMLVISHVFTGNGAVFPLCALAAETRKRGVLLVVDGAHAPGALELNFETLEDVDFYGGNLHKWMMGPKGTSFGWVARRNRELLQPLMAGWTTYESQGPFAAFAPGDRFQGLMLNSSCVDFAPMLAIPAMLAYWREKGPDRIRSRIYELQGYLEREVGAKLGWVSWTPPIGPFRGPLVSFPLPKSARSHPQGPWAWMSELLAKHGLQVSTPPFPGPDGTGACLRFSPHIYNTEAEIDRAVAVLRSVQ